MIPLKLQLKNFISYGSQVQTINFEPYHLICLSGKNGHGKSALLDAITWSVWGQARKSGTSTKADEGLLRLGQSNMMVSLDFISHNTTYRIRREYSVISSKAIAQLDFGIIDPKTGHMRSLTDKTIRTTQEKINQTIGLDYDSFINSAFIRQGHSNEFSKKSARERKEILANILGLDRYEEMRKRAAEKARNLMQEKEVLAKSLESTLKELEQKSIVLTQLSEIDSQLVLIKKNEESLEGIHKTLEMQKKQLEEYRQIHTRDKLLSDQLTKSIYEQSQLFLSKTHEFRAVLRQSTTLQALSSIEEERELCAKWMQELHIKMSNYRALAHQFSLVKEQVQSLREKIIHEYNAAIQELTKTISHDEVSLQHLSQTVLAHQKNKIQLDTDLKKIKNALGVLKAELDKNDKIEDELLIQEKSFDKRKNFYHKYVAFGNSLKKEFDENKEKNELLAMADAQCPLCEQEISQDACSTLKERLAQKNSLYQHQLLRVTRLLKTMKEMLLQQHEMIAQLKQKQLEKQTHLAQHQELERRYHEYQQQCHLTQKALDEAELAMDKTKHSLSALQDQAKRYNSVDTAILERPDYQEKMAELKKIEVLIHEQGEVEKEYHRATQRLSQLVQMSQQHQTLRTQLALQQTRKQEIHELNRTIKKLKIELSEFKKSIAAVDLNRQELSLQEGERNHATQLKELALEKENLLQQKGGLENHKRLLEGKENNTHADREKIKVLLDASFEYQAIAQALSKEGIQALLIEESIPEIEQQANHLLAKLTDNQAHLTIESLRDLKSGSTRETLDIKISDALGIRPYEMFSGGEAFRIDFALRIAISKLLARRAGASLQLLVIDEGFGSQDEEGLAHIMDALYKIQEDFSKIVIVSHLSSMKDQFPVHFMVQKTAQGSSIRVIEQG